MKGATGSHRWRICVDGTGGHSYADFGHVPSAIHAICRAGAKIADFKVPEDPKTTFTIGTIKGGTTVNSIAAHCEVEVDMRSVNNEALLHLEAAVLKAFDEAVEEENRCWNVVARRAEMPGYRAFEVHLLVNGCQCTDESQHSLDMPLFWRPRHACTFSDRVL